MQDESLIRRLKAINALMSFDYGSLWVVGENIWKAKLGAKGYDLASNRIAHPGICIQGATGGERLHSVVPMLYGTSGRMSPAYQVINFFNNSKDAKHITYFGSYFGAVPIEVNNIGSRRVLDSDIPKSRSVKLDGGRARKHLMKAARDEKLKDMIRPNAGKSHLTVSELEGLRNFTRRYISI